MLTRYVDNVGQTHTRQQCIEWLLHPQHKSFHQLFVECRLNIENPCLANGITTEETVGQWTKKTIADTLLNVKNVCIHIQGSLNAARQCTIYLFCALLDVAALNMFLDILHASSNSIKFADEVEVKDVYDSVPTMILEVLCKEIPGTFDLHPLLCVKQHNGPELNHTRSDHQTLYTVLQQPQHGTIRTLVAQQHIDTDDPKFYNGVSVAGTLTHLNLHDSNTILREIVDIPSSALQRRHYFLCFCALLNLADADFYIAKVRTNMIDRFHYTK